MTAIIAAAGAGFAAPAVRTTQPFQSSEPTELYDPSAFDPTSKDLVLKAFAMASRGNIADAIESMQTAANRLVHQRSTDFELWDNLAELYCAQAMRESDKKLAAAARANGVAMLKEFRCAINLWQWTPEHGKCALPSLKNESPSLQNGRYNSKASGFIPNPELTPLCFRTLCDDGFQYDSQQPKGEVFEFEDMEFPIYSPAYWFEQDASNLPAIEKLCRVKLPPLHKRPAN